MEIDEQIAGWLKHNTQTDILPDQHLGKIQSVPCDRVKDRGKPYSDLTREGKNYKSHLFKELATLRD